MVRRREICSRISQISLREHTSLGAFREAFAALQRAVTIESNKPHAPESAFRSLEAEIQQWPGEVGETFYAAVIDKFLSDWRQSVGLSATSELRLFEKRLYAVTAGGDGSTDILSFVTAVKLAFGDLMRARDRLKSGEVFRWSQTVKSSAELKQMINRFRFALMSGFTKATESQITATMLAQGLVPEGLSFAWLEKTLRSMANLVAEEEFDGGRNGFLSVNSIGQPQNNPNPSSGFGTFPGPSKALLVCPPVGSCDTAMEHFIFCSDPNHRRAEHRTCLHGIPESGGTSKICLDPRCGNRSHPVVDGKIRCPNEMADKLHIVLKPGIRCDLPIDGETGRPASPKFFSHEWTSGRASEYAAVQSRNQRPSAAYTHTRGPSMKGAPSSKGYGKTAPKGKGGFSKGGSSKGRTGKEGSSKGNREGVETAKKGWRPQGRWRSTAPASATLELSNF